MEYQVKATSKVSIRNAIAKPNIAEYKFVAELSIFQRTVGLSEAEDASFKATTFTSLQNLVGVLQEEQERDTNMLYMKRLKPFLDLMKAFVEVSEVAEVFVDMSDVNSYLWVSNCEHFHGN